MGPLLLSTENASFSILTATDDDLSTLSFVFGPMLMPALTLVDRGDGGSGYGTPDPAMTVTDH